MGGLFSFIKALTGVAIRLSVYNGVEVNNYEPMERH
jgi:hypothetical protein